MILSAHLHWAFPVSILGTSSSSLSCHFVLWNAQSMTASVTDKQLKFSRWQNWVENDNFQTSSQGLMSRERFWVHGGNKLRLSIRGWKLHTHHLADREPSRQNSLTIDKLLLNFKLPRCRAMKDEVGEGWGEKEGKHHLSQLNRNWLSPSRERCEGWDWVIGSLPRGGVCTVCALNSPTRWTRNTAEHETW